MMRIGLFGGTFDPPHYAHLKLAEWVRLALKLNRIYFIPAAMHAFKKHDGITSAELRFEMVAAAVSTYEHLRVSRIELDRPGISYTVDTLNDFMAFEGLPASDLYYILGSDNLRDFKHWKDPDKILELVTLVVIRRAGFSMPEETVNSHKKIMFLQSPIIEISATEIREKLKSKQDISAIVPAEVEKIIRKNHLYHTG